MTAPTLPATMTVWRQDRYGTAATVTSRAVPTPAPGPGEVLVRTEAVSINSGDIHLMQGSPRMVRLFFGIRRPRIRGRGMDLAGVVVAVGTGVDALAVGDRVVGAGTETLAEHVVVAASALTVLPDGVDPADAACLPVAGNTAVVALAGRDLAGSRVLVVGAGGGVGTLTVQLAAARGAKVWATCGARAEATLAGLGAAHTVDYRTVPVSDLPRDHFDLVVDIAGLTPLPMLRERLRAGGVVALVGGEGGAILGPIPRLVRSVFARRRGRRFRPVTATTKSAVTAELVDLLARGILTPVIERRVPLTDAAAALAHVEEGRTVGKVVVVA